MATCPACGANSRSDATFALQEVLVPKDIGTFSLAGAPMKVAASSAMRLAHSCGWSVLGHIDGESFIADVPAR